MIAPGDRLPEGCFTVMTPDGPSDTTMTAVFAGRTVVLFAVPGAFTPTCSREHLPGYLEEHDAIKARGVHTIACLAVNDVFVLDAWARSHGVGDRILMLADGNGTFTRALGLELDATGFGMGIRARRFSMIVDDGVVRALDVEPAGACGVSSARVALDRLSSP